MGQTWPRFGRGQNTLALLKTVHQRQQFSLAEFSAHFTTQIKMSIVNVRASLYIVCLNCISGQFVKTDNLDRSQFQIQPPHQTSHSQGLLSTRYYVYSSDLGACRYYSGHEHLNIAKIGKVPYLRILCYLRKHKKIYTYIYIYISYSFFVLFSRAPKSQLTLPYPNRLITLTNKIKACFFFFLL